MTVTVMLRTVTVTGHAISKKNCWYQDARATFQGQARAQVKQLVAIAWSLISLFCFAHATHSVVPIDKEFIADYVTVRIKLLLVTCQAIKRI